jgi:hypothetical protein
MNGHTTFVSRQCAGLSDPEGELDQGKFEGEEQHSATASDGSPRKGTLHFDDPCHDITAETPMPEAHTSNDN